MLGVSSFLRYTSAELLVSATFFCAAIHRHNLIFPLRSMNLKETLLGSRNYRSHVGNRFLSIDRQALLRLNHSSKMDSIQLLASQEGQSVTKYTLAKSSISLRHYESEESLELLRSTSLSSPINASSPIVVYIGGGRPSHLILCMLSSGGQHIGL